MKGGPVTLRPGISTAECLVKCLPDRWVQWEQVRESMPSLSLCSNYYMHTDMQNTHAQMHGTQYKERERGMRECLNEFLGASALLCVRVLPGCACCACVFSECVSPCIFRVCLRMCVRRVLCVCVLPEWEWLMLENVWGPGNAWELLAGEE